MPGGETTASRLLSRIDPPIARLVSTDLPEPRNFGNGRESPSVA